MSWRWEPGLWSRFFQGVTDYEETTQLVFILRSIFMNRNLCVNHVGRKKLIATEDGGKGTGVSDNKL